MFDQRLPRRPEIAPPPLFRDSPPVEKTWIARREDPAKFRYNKGLASFIPLWITRSLAAHPWTAPALQGRWTRFSSSFGLCG